MEGSMAKQSPEEEDWQHKSMIFSLTRLKNIKKNYNIYNLGYNNKVGVWTPKLVIII